MSTSFRQGQILDKFKGKQISERVRKKLAAHLMENESFSATGARRVSSSQILSKKTMADMLKDKSYRRRREVYRKMGMGYADKREFERKYFGKSKLSKHEMKMLEKKYERMRNRNISLSKRAQDELDKQRGVTVSKKDVKEAFREKTLSKATTVQDDKGRKKIDHTYLTGGEEDQTNSGYALASPDRDQYKNEDNHGFGSNFGQNAEGVVSDVGAGNLNDNLSNLSSGFGFPGR